jgi:hypothetical protein
VGVERGFAYRYGNQLFSGSNSEFKREISSDKLFAVTDDVGNRNNLLTVPESDIPIAQPKHDEDPPTAEDTNAIPHSVAEMVNTISERFSGQKPVEDAQTDTSKEKEAETSKQQAEPKEHTMITPAHTNTPVPETVVDSEEGDAPEVDEIPKGAQLNIHHVHEDASIALAAADGDIAQGQHIPGPIALLHPSDSMHSQEVESQASSASLTPFIPGTHEPTSTPAVQFDQPSSKTTSSPTLIIEKVDDELRHGDDFGSAATVGQKDAHLLHSQDAVPDHIIMRSDSRTPELADTAAEVSESAALLDWDRDPPTPPMSDEEAGRIGYRRMSSTPIPEVAKTAAEVADVAATLDEPSVVSSGGGGVLKYFANSISLPLKLHPIHQKSKRMRRRILWILVQLLQHPRRPQDSRTSVLVRMISASLLYLLIANRQSIRLSPSIRHMMNP